MYWCERLGQLLVERRNYPPRFAFFHLITDRQIKLAAKYAFLAAIIHDMHRIDDDVDHNHGERASKNCLYVLEDLGFKLEKEELDIIVYCVVNHCLPNPEVEEWNLGHLALMILKDADSLDICRLDDYDPYKARLPWTAGQAEKAELLNYLTEDRVDHYGRVRYLGRLIK